LVKLLITDDGHFEGSGLGLGNARMGYTYSPAPADVTLRPDSSTSTVSTAGFINYEIVYSGATKDSMRLLYREYTPQDLVRPAFTQDLVYERGSPTISFRNTLIRVLEASARRFVMSLYRTGTRRKRSRLPPGCTSPAAGGFFLLVITRLS
jgi:hypothetical protein